MSGQHSHGLQQDCGISSADALEIPQSCTKPSTWSPGQAWAYDMGQHIHG